MTSCQFRKSSPLQRMTTRIVLAALVLAVGAPLFAAGPGAPGAPGEVRGRVVGEDGLTPRQGVVVHVWQPGSETRYSSQPSGDDGRFDVSQVPAGVYGVVAETEQGLFVTPGRLTVEDGRPSALALQLAPGAPGNADGEAVLAPAQAGGGMPTWGKVAIAGGLLILAAILFEDIGEDEQETASAF